MSQKKALPMARPWASASDVVDDVAANAAADNVAGDVVGGVAIPGASISAAASRFPRFLLVSADSFTPADPTNAFSGWTLALGPERSDSTCDVSIIPGVSTPGTPSLLRCLRFADGQYKHCDLTSFFTLAWGYVGSCFHICYL